MRLVLISPPDFKLQREVHLLHKFADRGLRTFHLRKPGATIDQYRQYLKQLEAPVREIVVVHHHHGLAGEFDIKGVHYTEAARPPPPLSPQPNSTISTSFHSLADLKQNWGSLDYAFLSPIFDSISKVGYQAATFDPQALQSTLSSSTLPVIALGGISEDKVAVAASMGFAGVAVLGSVWQSEDPEAAFTRMVDACDASSGVKHAVV